MRDGERLADAGPGDWLVIRRVLFEELRARCGERGIRAGRLVQVLEREEAGVVLRCAGGVVRCPAGDASFVEVERVGQVGEVGRGRLVGV